MDPVTPLVRAKGGELGVRTELMPGLQSSLALWHARRSTRELLFVGDAGTTEAGAAVAAAAASNGTTTGAPLPWLLLDADLAWTSARFTDDDPAGDHIPGAIETAVSRRRDDPAAGAVVGAACACATSARGR